MYIFGAPIESEGPGIFLIREKHALHSGLIITLLNKRTFPSWSLLAACRANFLTQVVLANIIKTNHTGDTRTHNGTGGPFGPLSQNPAERLMGCQQNSNSQIYLRALLFIQHDIKYLYPSFNMSLICCLSSGKTLVYIRLMSTFSRKGGQNYF